MIIRKCVNVTDKGTATCLKAKDMMPFYLGDITC